MVVAYKTDNCNIIIFLLVTENSVELSNQCGCILLSHLAVFVRK